MDDIEIAEGIRKGHELTDAVTAAVKRVDDAVKRIGAEGRAFSVEAARELRAADEAYRAAEDKLREFVESSVRSPLL